MKEHQKAIINDYISSAMISDDPEENILTAIYYFIETFVKDEELTDVVEWLYIVEQKMIEEKMKRR